MIVMLMKEKINRLNFQLSTQINIICKALDTIQDKNRENETKVLKIIQSKSVMIHTVPLGYLKLW